MELLSGFFIVISAMYWMVQAMKYHKMAKTQSAGYQPFNHNASDDRPQPQRRRSNAPLIVEVDPNNPASSPMSSTSSTMSSAAKQKQRFSQPLIRNAVPPSPFVGTQGTDSYVAIPMSITKSTIPRSGCSTPQAMSPGPTVGQSLHDEEEEEPMNDTLDEPQAEDSMDDEEEDGKREVEEETPRGSPERKTSEGNDTMC